MIDASPRQAPRYLSKVLLGVGLVILADLLHVRPYPTEVRGWTPGALTLGSLLALMLTHAKPLSTAPRRGLVALVATLALLMVETPRTGVLLLATGALSAYALVLRHGWTHRIRHWIERTFAWGLFSFAQPFDDFRALRRARRRGRPPTEPMSAAATEQQRREERGSWFGRWIVPAGLGFVFLGLFASANPIFSGVLDDVGGALQGLLDALRLDLDAARVVSWGIVGWGAWSLLRTRIPAEAQDGVVIAPMPNLLAPAVLVRCLVVFNLVFLLQNAIDIRHLFLGEALPEGMSYADYARRGAFPLVAAAMLAALFVLMAFRAGPASETRRSARWLVVVWLGQTVLLTCGAAWRLALYVEAYGLTRLRLAAGVWMALVALGLLLIGWRILRSRTNTWLVGMNALAVLVALLAWAAVDTERVIADVNVTHCAEMDGPGPSIDLDYLGDLGAGSLPALRRLAAESRSAEVASAAQIRADLVRGEIEARQSVWHTWTWRGARLLAGDP